MDGSHSVVLIRACASGTPSVTSSCYVQMRLTYAFSYPWTICAHMRPLRIMEPVTTEDTQYHIFDTGVDYADGTVDSIAIGGAFATVKRLSDRADDASLRKAAKKS